MARAGSVLASQKKNELDLEAGKLNCVAPGDTCVRSMRRRRHRVENRVGEVQARGGGRGEVGWGGAGRWGYRGTIAALGPGNFVCVCVSVSKQI